ncbi:unnamed protein product [Heligmosomoides polygyrus]|uniref:MFS domain-containing protein n=1 Tax=Heligmosomoides polygyrus TaxID=6339 RepID=A0A183F867_HELPZ|nr:unnamed protein product [Heligmosomoides polygyrus]
MSSSGVVARHRSISRESRLSSDSDVSDVFIDEPTTEYSMRPREMLSSFTFYFLFWALFCCSFYANMFYNLYKTFAETFVEDDFFLARAFAIGSVANAIARVAWGYLTDRTSFQVTVSVATCMASALLLTMPITKDFGRHLFLVWLVGIFICMGATHALFITSAVKCFGVRWKATNYGFLTFSTDFSIFC